MKVSIKKLSKSKIELEIEVSAEEFDRYIEKATFDLGKNLEVEGFRKGKAPKEVIQERIDREKILAKAVEQAVKENYLKAVFENKIEVISQPEIQILKVASGNPLQFRVKATVLPEIDLPDYKKIASETKRRKVQVSEGEVENTLSWLQKSRAKFVAKNKPAQKKDFVEIEFSSPQIENNQKRHDNFILGEGGFLQGFEEKLINMSSGQEKEFSLSFPEDYFRKELAGKKVDFKVKMKSVQRMILPEMNDQFAQSLGKFENFSALKKSIQEGIEKEKENRESQRLRQEILAKIVKKTKMEIPEILIKAEQKRMLEDFKKLISEKFGTSFEDYLTKIKKTEKELLATFLPETKRKIKHFLCLKRIADKEKIGASEEEIKSAINDFLKRYSSVEKAKEELDLERLKSYYEEVIRNEKTLAKLESFAQ